MRGEDGRAALSVLDPPSSRVNSKHLTAKAPMSFSPNLLVISLMLLLLGQVGAPEEKTFFKFRIWPLGEDIFDFK